MELSVIRYSSGEESTLGMLLINSRFACYTLEDEARAIKVAGETRIPAGRYPVVLRTEGSHHQKYKQRYPAMHKGMLHITQVPDFRWILIHTGNDDDATAGCLLVGDSTNNNNIRDGFISNSRDAYKRIYPEIAGALTNDEPVWITYYDQIPLAEAEKNNSANRWHVTADRLNLRNSPGGLIKGELFDGTETKVTASSDGWHKVNLEGWVFGDYLRKHESEAHREG